MWTRLGAFVTRLNFVWRRRHLDDDARQEIQTHLELLEARYVGKGMTPAEARTAAHRQFGHAPLTREDLHEMNSIGWLEQFAGDFRYAMRQLRAAPGFVVAVAATLSLGIGGTTAVYSVMQAVVLAPLPYTESEQLVRFYQQEPNNPGTRGVLAATHFAFVRDRAAAFTDVAALANYRETGLDLVVPGAPAERLNVLRVSSGYFATLGTPLAAGRGFERDDETGARRVVLSHAVWRARFRGDPSIVGTTIRLSAEPYDVAGVAAPDFADPIVAGVDAWIPYPIARDTDPENNSLSAIGRLRRGVTLEQAGAELASIGVAMRAEWPQATSSLIVALPLHDTIVGRARSLLVPMFVGVGLVLLLACVNVANLMLVRAAGRVREFAVRTALGSSRTRLVRQLIVENVLFASLGGVAGVLLARAGIDTLQALGRDALPRLDGVSLDGRVLAFALLTTIATALVSGLAPVVRLTRVSPTEALRRQTRSATSGRGVARVRATLVTIQVALALTLLAGAGVMLATVRELQQVPLGFRVDGALTFETNLPSARYDESRRATFFEELAARLDAVPGVEAAGGISRLPGTGSYHPWNTRVMSGPAAGRLVDGGRFAMQQRVVSGRAFDALGVALLAGRTFDTGDDSRAPARAVVSEHFVQQAFPGFSLAAVLGQRIATAGRELEIIGVVGDVALDVYGAETMVVYHAHRQFAGNRNWALMQVVASPRPIDQLLADVRRAVAALDPEIVVHRPAALPEVVGRGASRERFALILMTVFAAVSVILAALGLYGVLAYVVRERSAEIGIRMALGATSLQVRSLVLRQATLVVLTGMAFGLMGALALGQWLATLAFGISPSDPRVLAAASVLLLMVALVAAWLPAARAARVEPKTAMRD